MTQPLTTSVRVMVSQKKKTKTPTIKTTRPYPFAFGSDPIRCSLCHKLYADTGSYNDHIICCKNEHPDEIALMYGRFPLEVRKTEE